MASPSQYLEDVPAPAVAEYAEAIVGALRQAERAYGLPSPRLIVEPGRAVVSRACVALYSVGASKDIPGVRKYVAVDGGLSDNIRPALYGARYSALVANKLGGAEGERVTIAGKFCESGDVLLRDAYLPAWRRATCWRWRWPAPTACPCPATTTPPCGRPS